MNHDVHDEHDISYFQVVPVVPSWSIRDMP